MVNSWGSHLTERLSPAPRWKLLISVTRAEPNMCWAEVAHLVTRWLNINKQRIKYMSNTETTEQMYKAIDSSDSVDLTENHVIAQRTEQREDIGYPGRSGT
jgi:hypothetical protein